MRVDAVFENARVLVPGGISSAVAVLHGRIVALGAGAAALSARERVDLAGSCVVPGFHDAHNHLAWFGMSLDEVPLGPDACASVEDVYDAIARRAATLPAGRWVVGSGYDQNKLAGGHPTRQGLDRAAPEHPVRLKHTSGHMSVVNSAVLERLDLGNVPVGGDVVTDATGSPTGLLREQAQLLLRPLIYPTPLDTVVRAIDRASERFLAEGITSVQEAGIGGGLVGETPCELAAYQRAREEGVLRVRGTLMVASSVLHEIEHAESDEVAFSLDLGMRSGFGDDWLRIGPMKIFADGSLIGRTSAMHEDFAGEPGNRGYFQLPERELAETILRAHAAGWQVATHAIGDRAVTAVLDAYAAALARYPRADHRHRIEHCGVIPPGELRRLAGLGLIPVPQGRFVHEIGDGMLAALGPERADWCYRGRSFLDAGCVLPGSSDRPVVRGAPLLGIADLVRRRTAGGQPLGAAEALTPAQALRAYTAGSAYAAFRERDLGTLEPGKLADFAVLSADPTEEANLDSVRVLGTVIGGELVYQRS
ncbi:amidohydrolase [Amycolatopsis cihanbeyliensis]|uniref:Amidohydrolase 3 domain-containing protein n=1 Tax=Amycolatopsis cihanbeyliensis TaxID=1128664 RepID=A0A542DIK1_AMYCI|nr:amidohydrolase [Amycolatopsis cihanbeyliensis]TQJ02824.1 hypothetical protein FB471_2570 [Amycolatopsis cihanbeyliensis]